MTKRALFVGLVFYTHTYTIQTLKSLPNTFDVVLLECNSPQSTNIQSAIDDLKMTWKGSMRHVLYSKNIIGLVYRKFFRENSNLLSQYDIIVTSDMDVEFSVDTNWLACFETIETQENIGVLSFACSDINHNHACMGFDSLKVKNPFISNNSKLNIGRPVNDNNTGWQCIIMTAVVANNFFVQSVSTPVLDSELGLWLKRHGKIWYVIADFKVKHLMWDAYVFPEQQTDDVKDYLDFKKNQFHGWIQTEHDCIALSDRIL